MANEQRDYTAEELQQFDAEVERLRNDELPHIREEEVRAAAQRAVSREVEIERDYTREELAGEVERSTTETAQEERRETNRTVPAQLVGLVAALILVLLVAAARHPEGLLGFLGFARSNGDASGVVQGNATAEPLQGILGGSNAANSGDGPITASQTGRGNPDAGGVDPLGGLVGLDGATLDSLFRPVYAARLGLRLCGLPLAPAITVRGRRIQWTERCRIEHWPEFAGTESEFQLGLLGSEYTDERRFPPQQFFASRPDLQFFPETGHAVGEPFLSYWQQNGGLTNFGYPISDVVQEVMADDIVRTVQYFQRVRMESHPEQPDAENRVMLGLLGRALYLKEAVPNIVTPLQPTAVPLP